MSSTIIKIEPIEESSVVDVSSDDDNELVPSRKNEAPKVKHPDRPGTPDKNCSICLEELTNTSYSDSCWHLFCFDCLKRWSAIESSCPLCKKPFKIINHTFNDKGLHQTYEVPSVQERDFPMHLFLDIIRRSEERLISNLSIGDLNPIFEHIPYYDTHFPSLITPSTYPRDLFEGRRQQNGHAMRTQVYDENMYAIPLPDLSGRFRDCSTAYYRDNPAQTHRLHGFIIRDIMAIRNILNRNTVVPSTIFIPSNEFIASRVLQAILMHEIRDPEMNNLLFEFLGEHTEHFCHELHNFANSPYDMIGYDRNVRFVFRDTLSPLLTNTTGVFEPSAQPPPVAISTITNHNNETIILDSEDDDDDIVETGIIRYRPNTDVIILSSSSEEDNSDVEILENPSYRPMETFDSSLDQPSTSTGIRASFDRPNSRYNFRRRRMFSPIRLSRMQCIRSGRIIIDDTSSDDEAITPPTTVRTKNRFICKKRRKMKKNKVKKRKRNNDDSRSEIHNGSRSGSISESSTSSTDIDAGPSTNFVPLRTNISTIN